MAESPTKAPMKKKGKDDREEEGGGEWGTWEELSLASAIKRYGIEDWTKVSWELQICLWIFFWRSPDAVIMFFSNIFIAAWSLCAASGFLIYGGRLFIMLRRFPAESRGRQNKLQEIGLVTTVCFSCFLIRCLMILSSAFLKSAEINPLKRPLITSVYYLLVEIIPATLVLFILRKLPRPSVHVDRPGSSGGRDDHSSFMASA